MISRSITSEDLIAFNLYLLNHFTLGLNLDSQLASQLKQTHQQTLSHKYLFPQNSKTEKLCCYNFLTQQPIAFLNYSSSEQLCYFDVSKARELIADLQHQELQYINNHNLDTNIFSYSKLSHNISFLTQPELNQTPSLQYIVNQIITQPTVQQLIHQKIVEWNFHKLLSYFGKQLNFLENLHQHPRFQRLVDHCAREDASMWIKGLAKLKQVLPLLLEQELLKLISSKKISLSSSPEQELIIKDQFWNQITAAELQEVFNSSLRALTEYNCFSNATITFKGNQSTATNKHLLPRFHELPYHLSQPEQLCVAYSDHSTFTGINNNLTITLFNEVFQDITNLINFFNSEATDVPSQNSLADILNHCLGLLIKNLEFKIQSHQNVYGVPLVIHRVLHLVTRKQHIEFNEQLDYENYLGNQHLTTFARDNFNKYLSHREPTGVHLHGLYHLMRNKHKSKVVPKVIKSNITLSPQNVTLQEVSQVELTIPTHLKSWSLASNKSQLQQERLQLLSNLPLLHTRIEQELAQQLTQQYCNKVYLEEVVHQLSPVVANEISAAPAKDFDQLQILSCNLPMRSYLQAALNLLHNSVKKSLFTGVNVFTASSAFLSLGWLYEAILHHLSNLLHDNVVNWKQNAAIEEILNNLLSLRGNSSLLLLEPNKNYKHLLVHEFKKWFAQNDNLNHIKATELQALALHFDAGILKPHHHVFTYLTNHAGVIRGLRMELLGITLEWEVVNPRRSLNVQETNYNHPFASHTLSPDEYVVLRTRIKPMNYLEARVILALLFGKQEVSHPTFGLEVNYDMLQHGLEICDTVRITELDILRKNVTSYLPNNDTDFTALWDSL